MEVKTYCFYQIFKQSKNGDCYECATDEYNWCCNKGNVRYIPVAVVFCEIPEKYVSISDQQSQAVTGGI